MRSDLSVLFSRRFHSATGVFESIMGHLSAGFLYQCSQLPRKSSTQQVRCRNLTIVWYDGCLAYSGLITYPSAINLRESVVGLPSQKVWKIQKGKSEIMNVMTRACRTVESMGIRLLTHKVTSTLLREVAVTA